MPKILSNSALGKITWTGSAVADDVAFIETLLHPWDSSMGVNERQFLHNIVTGGWSRTGISYAARAMAELMTDHGLLVVRRSGGSFYTDSWSMTERGMLALQSWRAMNPQKLGTGGEYVLETLADRPAQELSLPSEQDFDMAKQLFHVAAIFHPSAEQRVGNDDALKEDAVLVEPKYVMATSATSARDQLLRELPDTYAEFTDSVKFVVQAVEL